MRGTVRLRQLHAKHGDRVEFLFIYIREAHPTDKWALDGAVIGRVLNVLVPQAAYDIPDPTTLDERTRVAVDCKAAAGFTMRMVVDDMGDEVDERWGGWPTRLYLVDVHGKVVYAGGPGPYGFKPKEFGKAVEQIAG
jgi:hypothetical protein